MWKHLWALKIIHTRRSSLLHMGLFKTIHLSLPGKSVLKGYSSSCVHSLLWGERALFSQYNSLRPYPLQTRAGNKGTSRILNLCLPDKRPTIQQEQSVNWWRWLYIHVRMTKPYLPDESPAEKTMFYCDGDVSQLNWMVSSRPPARSACPQRDPLVFLGLADV